MLLPISQVPTKYFQPLCVNPGEDYTIDEDKFPGLYEREHQLEPALILAPVTNSCSITSELLDTIGDREDDTAGILNRQNDGMDRNRLPSCRYESLIRNHQPPTTVHVPREQGGLFALLSCIDDDSGIQNTRSPPEATITYQPETIRPCSFQNDTRYSRDASFISSNVTSRSRPPSKPWNDQTNGRIESCQSFTPYDVGSVWGFSTSPLREPQVLEFSHSDPKTPQPCERKRNLPVEDCELIRDEYSCPVVKRPRSDTHSGPAQKRHTIHYYGHNSKTKVSSLNNTRATNLYTTWNPQINFGVPRVSRNFGAMFGQSPVNPRRVRQS